MGTLDIGTNVCDIEISLNDSLSDNRFSAQSLVKSELSSITSPLLPLPPSSSYSVSLDTSTQILTVKYHLSDGSESQVLHVDFSSSGPVNDHLLFTLDEAIRGYMSRSAIFGAREQSVTLNELLNPTTKVGESRGHPIGPFESGLPEIPQLNRRGSIYINFDNAK